MLSIEISAPHQIYYINSDVDEGHYVFAIDATETLKIDGDASVTLYGLDNNCISIANLANSVMAPGVPQAAVPKGQFVQMDVVSVKPLK